MRHRRWLALAAGMAGLFPTMAHATAPNDASASLRRTAAAMDAIIDVYRLALVEIVPALVLVEAAGYTAAADDQSPVPDAARQAFARLAGSVQQRIHADTLNALSAAYHVEIVAALEALAAAPCLGAVRLPARRLLEALQHEGALAAAIIDIFSRRRPLVAQVLGPESVLDSLNEALGQLTLAEANLGTVRRRGGTAGEQLQALLRLELVLGQALDRIATAERAGIELGFEMPQATVGLAAHVQQMQARLSQMSTTVQAMERLPVPPGMDLWAVVQLARRESDAPEAQLLISWTPPVPGPLAPAYLRIYEASGPGWGTAKAEPAHLLAQLASGRSSWTAAVRQQPTLPRRYYMASVSPFGVEHVGPAVQALLLPAELAPPQAVVAELSAVPPDSEAYYHEAGAVTVRWQASASDTSGKPQAKAYATRQALPQVAHYAIYRWVAAELALVGTVPEGVTTWVDRPPLEQLAAGVHYTVAAREAQNHSVAMVGAAGHSAQSAMLRCDLGAPLALAAAGGAVLERPTTYEKRAMQRFAADAARLAAQTFFCRRPASERQLLMQQFWAAASSSQRLRWHRTWPQRLAAPQRRALFEHAPLPVFQRDAAWAAAGMWAQQNPAFASEPERFFGLLTASAQHAAQRAWEDGLGPQVVAAVHRAQAAGATQFDWAEPVQQQIWYQHRDPEEQARLQHTFATAPVASQQLAADAWFMSLPEVLRQAVAWPPWESLTPDERAAFMQSPPSRGDKPLWPESLWPELLAWVAWHDLDSTTKTLEVACDVGFGAHWLARLRYALRPIDLRFDFKLTLYASLVLLGLFTGALLRLARRTR